MLLLTVIALSALSRSATVDVQAVRPLLKTRESVDAELRRLRGDLGTVNTDIVDDGQESRKPGCYSLTVCRRLSCWHSQIATRKSAIAG